MTADSDLLTVHDRAGTAGAEPAEPAAAAPVPASQHLRGGDDRFGAAADDGDAGTSKDAGDAPTGLADLPPALLHGVVALCWAQAGAPAVLALSRTGRALLRACDGVLAAQRALPQAATAPLRAGPLPGPARAGAVMGRLLKHMRSVAAIDLSGMHFWVYDSSLAAIGASCPMLETLRLDFCQNITGDGLTALTAQGRMARLRDLSICSCGDVGPGSFLAGLPSLQALRAAYCHSLQGDQVLAAAPRLEYLDLTGCDAVGDEICGALPAALALNLSFVPISDAGLAALAEGSPRLASLALARRSNNLWSVGLHTDAGVAALKARLPGLAVRYTM